MIDPEDVLLELCLKQMALKFAEQLSHHSNGTMNYEMHTSKLT